MKYIIVISQGKTCFKTKFFFQLQKFNKFMCLCLKINNLNMIYEMKIKKDLK